MEKRQYVAVGIGVLKLIYNRELGKDLYVKCSQSYIPCVQAEKVCYYTKTAIFPCSKQMEMDSCFTFIYLTANIPPLPLLPYDAFWCIWKLFPIIILKTVTASMYTEMTQFDNSDVFMLLLTGIDD